MWSGSFISFRNTTTIFVFVLLLNRSDHVIIQSYDEHIDTNRLYVALFIKDPYRRTIALTNEQFLTAIKSNQKQIYQDIKHHVTIISN